MIYHPGLTVKEFWIYNFQSQFILLRGLFILLNNRSLMQGGGKTLTQKFYSIKLHYKCAKRILLAGNVDTCHHRWNNHFCCSSPAHQTPSKKEHLCILIFWKKKRTCKKCVRFHVANVKQQEKGRFWYNPIRWINLTLNYFNQNK